ncbi:MAG: hypothetical protein ABSB70_21835 [Candidatus Velthaea sp.]|jgi:hypothetical protein
MSKLYESEAAANLITSGKSLLLAGDEKLLATLPKGDWIGGTIPYFMAPEGGLQTADRVFVTELPPGSQSTIRSYDAASLRNIASDHPGHGFTVLMIPAFTDVHAEYAKNVAHYPGIFDRPIVGWVSGVALEQIGSVLPRTFDGSSATGSSDHAVALHVKLPEDDQVSVEIINLFQPGDGDAIAFSETSFSVTDVLVNGKPVNLAKYLTDNDIDTRLPLVADYNGAMINVSIQQVDVGRGTVDFYAPVFPGIAYHVAAPVGDYVSNFAAHLPGGSEPAFSCNCILNYVYAGLEGRSTAPLFGPMTFGEIAYMLLNQTAVSLTVTSSG